MSFLDLTSNFNKDTIVNMGGMKPSLVHLGHLLSIVSNAKRLSKNQLFFMLIADYNKYESCMNTSVIREMSSIISNLFAENQNIIVYKQSSYTEKYGKLFFLLSSLINKKSLDKIYSINYGDKNANFVSYYYPLLMLLDILLISPCIVHVSYDQIHNVRFIRNMCNEIEKLLGLKFSIEFSISDIKIRSLRKSTKMSTSSDSSDTLFLSDSYEVLKNKIMKVSTQSFMPKHKEEISDESLFLYETIARVRNLDIHDVVKQYSDKNFYTMKCDLIEILSTFFNSFKSCRKHSSSCYQHLIDERISINYNNLVSRF